jgi:hypothetical protein
MATAITVGLASACGGPPKPPDAALLGKMSAAKNIVFAYDLEPACELESLPGDADPSRSAPWKKLAANELAASRAEIVEKRTDAEDPRARFRALRVKDASGRTRWLRNTPAASAADVERRWSCAVDADLAASRLKPITVSRVRLVASAPTCTGVTTILGDASEVSFEPYAIVGRRLFHTRAGLVAAVTLATEDGESVLTISGADLDACFAATKRSPVPSAERTSLLAWLGDPSAPPPNVPLPSYLHAVGLDDGACLAEGEGPTRHDECRAAPIGVTKGEASALGDRVVFFRDRVAEAVHAYGGKLAPADELAGINVAVQRVHAREEGGFGGAFGKALLASLLDPARQRARAVRGYRLLRPSDVSAGTTANATLDVDVSYATPKLETTQQDRRQRRVRGKTSAPNPAKVAAARRLEGARAASRSAESSAPIYDRLFASPQPKCETGAASCDVAARRDIGSAHVAKRREHVSAQESAAAAVPDTIEQDDVVAVDYRAKVYSRKGEASVTLKLTPTDALPGMPPLQLTRKVPFDATEVEVLADPAKGVEAKAAKPPEREQVDAAVSSALLAEIDQVLGVWMRRTTAAAPPASFEVGSRAHLALLARHAASNRKVKLVSDLVDDRPETIAARRASYPITVPAGAGRCYAFVATPLRRGGDVDLTLRARTTGALGARDVRSGSDAGVDACPLAPGDYVLEVAIPQAAPAGPFALGMFESTPGTTPDPDYGATTPTSLRDHRPYGAATTPAPTNVK